MKALNRGRADHFFSASVTYLHFSIQARFSCTLPARIFLMSLFYFQPKKERFSPVSLNFDLWPWSTNLT